MLVTPCEFDPIVQSSNQQASTLPRHKGMRKSLTNNSAGVVAPLSSLSSEKYGMDRWTHLHTRRKYLQIHRLKQKRCECHFKIP